MNLDNKEILRIYLYLLFLIYIWIEGGYIFIKERRNKNVMEREE
jgi:hypothetical protein